MSAENQLVEHIDQMNKVVSKYLEGSDPTKISKDLGIPRQKVVTYLDEWKVMASNNAAIRKRATEALVVADTHYDKLINQTYEVIDEAGSVGNLSAKTAGIKLVLDIESRRIDMLQKAGLLENKELAEEMVQIEKRQDILVSILRDIASEHPEIRDKVMRRLSEASKSQEVVTIIQNV